MVKVRKKSADEGGGSFTTVEDRRAGNAPFNRHRRKCLARMCTKALRMLTPRRAGPVGPEEIREGADDKGATPNAASGSVTPGSYENGDGSKEFLSTGRTGRRNALPNILGRHAQTGLSDLPDRFGALSTHTDQSTNSGQDPNIPGTSKQHG